VYFLCTDNSNAPLINIHGLIAVIRVGFDPVMYTVNETEGVVTVCISAMDTLTGGPVSVTLSTERGTAPGVFTQHTFIAYRYFEVIVAFSNIKSYI